MESKKRTNLIIGLVIVVVIVVIATALLTGGRGESPAIDKVENGEKTAKELQGLTLPKVGEEAPEEGVGVPGKIAEGESGKPGQQYWVFETELREGKLDPFEFRLPVGDILGISILNSETQERVLSISGTSAFVPNFIERTIAPGSTASIRTQVLEAGEYDIFCATCKIQIIGKFVVVPK